MADLGALQVLPPELHLLVLDFANLQTVCRFSQANRRARALVGGLFVGLDTVRSLLRSGPAVPRPARKLGNHVRVATSEVWTYGLLASTLCGRTGQTNNSPSPSYAGCGTCRRCADRSLSSLSVALLDPLVEERFHLMLMQRIESFTAFLRNMDRSELGLNNVFDWLEFFDSPRMYYFWEL